MELKIDNASIETLVKEHIKVAVADVLSKQSPYLISQLVNHALNAKQNSYDRTTILDDTIAKMIRDEAKAGMDEWLDSKRAEIRKQVHAALAKKSDGLVARIAEQLVIGLSKDLTVSTYLSSKSDQ